jgi:phosphopantothenate---cysteine ligase (CTP)
MMKNILITGGPVHAYLDDVKILTNKFKGGLMADLANQLVRYNRQLTDKIHVTYLSSKSSTRPKVTSKEQRYITYLIHDGIEDYMEKVLSLAPRMDAIVLGAAVANLIPKEKIQGKFPSHNYKPGDTIPIDFTIAPRIIDEVKKVNPKTLLFGYKLLSGVDYYELVRAAYGVLLESKAVTIFANDAKDLMQKYAVTKERGVHPIHNKEVFQWILDRMEEKYYKTITAKTDKITEEMKEAGGTLKDIIYDYKHSFIKVDEGYTFGSAAMRIVSEKAAFVTTARGKNEIDDIAFVSDVTHGTREVYCATTKKASLNAPLFHGLFLRTKEIKYILHFHHQREDLITLDYATPGTDIDSIRSLKDHSFNIKGHGCILSYNNKGELVK